MHNCIRVLLCLMFACYRTVCVLTSRLLLLLLLPLLLPLLLILILLPLLLLRLVNTAPSDVYAYLVGELNKKGGSSGFLILQAFSVADKYAADWKDHKEKHNWTAQTFRGKEMSHESMRWQYLADTHGRELVFTQTQFESCWGLLYQSRQLGAFDNFKKDILKTKVDHRHKDLDTYNFLQFASVAEKTVRGTYTKDSSLLPPLWRKAILTELWSRMLPFKPNACQHDHEHSFVWSGDHGAYYASTQEIKDFVNLDVTFTPRQGRTAAPPKGKRRKKDKDGTAGAAPVMDQSVAAPVATKIFCAAKDIFDEGIADLINAGIDTDKHCVNLIGRMINMIVSLGLTGKVESFDSLCGGAAPVISTNAGTLRNVMDAKLQEFSKGWLAVNNFSVPRKASPPAHVQRQTAAAPVTVAHQQPYSGRMRPEQLLVLVQWLQDNPSRDHKGHPTFMRLSTEIAAVELEFRRNLRMLVRTVAERTAHAIPASWSSEILTRVLTLKEKESCPETIEESDKVEHLFKDIKGAELFIGWRTNYIVDLLRFFCPSADGGALAAVTDTEGKLRCLMSMDSNAESPRKIIQQWVGLVDFALRCFRESIGVSDASLRAEVERLNAQPDVAVFGASGADPDLLRKALCMSPMSSPLPSPSPSPCSEPDESVAAVNIAQPELEPGALDPDSQPCKEPAPASAEHEAHDEEQPVLMDERVVSVAASTFHKAWLQQHSLPSATKQLPAKLIDEALCAATTKLSELYWQHDLPAGFRFTWESVNPDMVSIVFSPTVSTKKGTLDHFASAKCMWTPFKLYFHGTLSTRVGHLTVPIANLGSNEIVVEPCEFIQAPAWRCAVSESEDDWTVTLKTDVFTLGDLGVSHKDLQGVQINFSYLTPTEKIINAVEAAIKGSDKKYSFSLVGLRLLLLLILLLRFKEPLAF